MTTDHRPPTTIPPAVPTDELERLAAHLAAEPEEGVWRGWRVARVGGGSNNLLYHATGHGHNLAVKFTLRDSRDRAGREYAALTALRTAGLHVAPHPLWLDSHSFPLPVVIMTWLDGPVSDAPPTDDAAWDALLAHLAAIHQVLPATTPTAAPPAFMTMLSAADGRRRIQAQLERLPEGDRPAALSELVQTVQAARLPDWPPVAVALCRCDPNLNNFVRWPGRWASVDWENAGWGDPAFEVADLLAHPTLLGVSAERRAWLAQRYVTLRGEAALAERLATYQALVAVWWVARMARFLYEVPRGLDPRLVARPADWQAEAERKYQLYVDRARQAVREEE